MCDLLHQFCNFIHEAQKERGSVAFYLRGGGKEFVDESEAQFAVVDNCTKPLAASSRSWSAKFGPVEVVMAAGRNRSCGLLPG